MTTSGPAASVTPGRSATDHPVAAILLAGLAVLRLLLPWTPDRFFDVDPASVPGPFPAGGPGLSMLLDAAILVVAGGVLIRFVRRGPGLDPWLSLPAILPVIVVLWHGRTDVLQAWRGLDWFAATMLGVAMAHLVRAPSSRRLVVAIVLGGIAAMGIRGGWQVVVEHPDTVAYFEAHRAEILAARGWTADSAAALAFERRLRQPEATGWIGFSNVFSGLAAAASVLLIGGLAAWRVVRPVGAEAGGPVLVGLAGVGLAVLVGLNGSKGAVAAALLAVLVLGVVLGPGRDLEPRRLGLVVVGAGLLAIVAVLVRGLVPEDAFGDRSLLFRWHYLQGAWSMVAAHPVVGVGPDGFQDSYLLHRPLRSPEAVASAHGMVADWTASLGVLGVAWAVVAGVMLARDDADEAASSGSVSTPSMVTRVGVTVAIVFTVLLAQAFVERPAEGGAVAVRIAAATLGGLLGMVAYGLLESLDGRTVRRLALAAGIIVIVQGQIEMLFWQPGSIAVCWALVAAAGSARPARVRGVEAVGPITLGVAVIAGVLAMGDLEDAARAERALSPLHGAIARDGVVDPALRRGIAMPLSSLSADETWWDDRVIRGSIDLLMAAGADDDVRHADLLTERWTQRRPGPMSWNIRASVLREATRRGLVEPSTTLEAVAVAIGFDPTEPRRRLELAELLVELGRCDEAVAAIAEARRLDEAHDLDPLVRFGDRDLARLDAVLSACGAGRASEVQEPRP